MRLDISYLYNAKLTFVMVLNEEEAEKLKKYHRQFWQNNFNLNIINNKLYFGNIFDSPMRNCIEGLKAFVEELNFEQVDCENDSAEFYSYAHRLGKNLPHIAKNIDLYNNLSILMANSVLVKKSETMPQQSFLEEEIKHLQSLKISYANDPVVLDATDTLLKHFSDLNAQHEQQEKINTANRKLIRERAFKNGPVKTRFEVGENSIIDWILMGYYQEVPNQNSIVLIKDFLGKFLQEKPHLKSFLLTAALWITFWESITEKLQLNAAEIVNNLKLIEAETSFDDKELGEYRSKHTLYFRKILNKDNVATIIHELKHGEDKFFYHGPSLPFWGYKNQQWEKMAERIGKDQTVQMPVFSYSKYPPDQWVRELSARLMQAEFLDIQLPKKEYREFAASAMVTFCKDAEKLCAKIADELGLKLLKPFANGFNDASFILDDESCELLNAARMRKMTVIALVIEKMLASKQSPAFITEELLQKEFSLEVIVKATRNHALLQPVTEYVNNRIVDADPFLAVENGHLEALTSLIEDGIDINITDQNDNSLLHHAISNDQDDVVTWLITQDIEVNLKNDDGHTALALAAKKGNTHAAQAILSKTKPEFEIDAKDSSGKTPLHLAAMKGRIEIIPLLLNNGAFINSTDDQNHTPLHLAVYRDQIVAVEILISNTKIDINAVNQDKLTALHMAVIDNKPELVKLLLSHNDIDISLKDNEEKTALEHATASGNWEIIKLFSKLLKANTNTNSQNPRRFFSHKPVESVTQPTATQTENNDETNPYEQYYG